MKKLQFKCELLSDIVMSESSATTGMKKGLDFIPGSNFLGIVANQLYPKLDAMESHLLFHSGKVRFGDAHPSLDGRRGVRIPASLYYPKLKKLEENENYIHHRLNHNDESIRLKQLKQARSGFYTFGENHKMLEVKVDKAFSIKSAYDAEKRRSKDEAMFGYTAMAQGLTLCFEVELVDDAEKYADQIREALVGDRHVGRSRSAQYGWVHIEENTFEGLKSSSDSSEEVTVYADGRLIFVDDFGMPTFRPTADQLGLPGGEVLWEKCQIRTFQYTPWNSKRQAFDSDRCGIEKGSVFVVSYSEKKKGQAYVGSNNNEGFGSVVYNPEILAAEAEGRSKFVFESVDTLTSERGKVELAGTPLLEYIALRKNNIAKDNDTLSKVNEFVEGNWKLWKEEAFASQWGSIRALAMVYSGKILREKVGKYLDHGVAQRKWEQRGRYQRFKEKFLDNRPDDTLQQDLINLASEMAKKCRNKK